MSREDENLHGRLQDAEDMKSYDDGPDLQPGMSPWKFRESGDRPPQDPPVDFDGLDE